MALVFSWLFLSTLAGCLEIKQLLEALPPATVGANQTGPDGQSPSDMQEPSDNDAGVVPVVRLTASDPSPQLNDEVLLSCVVADESAGPFQFEFNPADRLIVDATRGTAALIVEGFDLGTSLTFTCRATNSTGTSQPSNEVLLIPG